MSLAPTFAFLSRTPTDRAATPRSPRVLALALVCMLAGGAGLAVWAASGDFLTSTASAPVAPLLAAGPRLDRILDDVRASPTQRAQTHQILDAAVDGLRRDHDAEGVDGELLARLFEQPRVDASAVEAVRLRVEARHDAASRRVAQAMIAVSLVLSPAQRQRIAHRLAAGPSPFAIARAPLPVFNE